MENDEITTVEINTWGTYTTVELLEKIKDDDYVEFYCNHTGTLVTVNAKEVREFLKILHTEASLLVTINRSYPLVGYRSKRHGIAVEETPAEVHRTLNINYIEPIITDNRGVFLRNGLRGKANFVQVEIPS